MKWFLFKLLVIGSLLSPTAAAENGKGENEGKTALGKRLIPAYAKIHFAGSMGMFSVGPGWLYGKRHWETDLLVGIVPIKLKKSRYSLTLKQNYIPWWPKLSRTLTLEPLVTGFYLNAILNDKDLWTRRPSRYPDGYYWHSNGIRFNIFLGQRLKLNLNATKSVSVFYEVSTCDLYLTKIFTNSYLKPRDYLTLCVGVRFAFNGN